MQNISGISNDSLCLYFENKRWSGGSGQVEVDLRRNDGCAIVTFEDPQSKAPFTQDAEVLANAANKKLKHTVVNGSVHTALQATSKDLPANLHTNLLTRPV